MIVLDASAFVDWLLQDPRTADAVAGHMRTARVLHSLDLVHVEVVSALRKHVAGRRLGASRAGLALDRLAATPLRIHRTAPLVQRIWSLRASHTSYDAAYVALAERLRIPLITTDGRLARSTGHRATIIEVPA